MSFLDSLFALLSSYGEKVSLGVSLCGFGLFLFCLYFTDLLLKERLISSVLIGTGLVGLLVCVFFWIRRHANVKAQQEREMFLSYKGDQKHWRAKFTFNNIITVVSELWSLGQLLYFSTHTGENVFGHKYLDFNYNLRFVMFQFYEFSYFIMFAAASFTIITISLFFGFGFMVHKLWGCCHGCGCVCGGRRKAAKDVEMARLKKSDDYEHEEEIQGAPVIEESTPSWDSFQRFILQITSIFYVSIYTQLLTALACEWDDDHVPHLMRYKSMKCYTGLHAFLSTFAIAVAVLFFPLNTYLLTVGTQPPITIENGEVIFIRDAVLMFTLVELLCSSLKLFYSQEKYRTLYLTLIMIIYVCLSLYLVAGRIYKRPACNSRTMFYLKISTTLAATFSAIANLAGAILDEERGRELTIFLVYIGWPVIAFVFIVWMFTNGRRGAAAFYFTIDMESLLKTKVIGFSLAVDNCYQSPPSYTKMDMMTLFTPVGTPWHSVILVLGLAGKRYVLAAKCGSNGPLYSEAQIIPFSHITEPIDLAHLDMNQLIHDIYIRYVRKDLRKFLKTLMGREQYDNVKHQLSLDEMMNTTYDVFVKSGMDQHLLKLNYPHLANYMLERFCREQPGNILAALGNAMIYNMLAGEERVSVRIEGPPPPYA